MNLGLPWKILVQFLILSVILFAQNGEKMNVAVLDFTNEGGLSVSESVTLTNRLRSTLVKTNTFNVLERGRMEEVLNEIGFQMTGCTSTDCAVEVGKILNVQQMITGSIGKLGKTYTIDISIIDVETAKIISSIYEDYKGEIDGLLNLMVNIANSIAGKEEQPEHQITTSRSQENSVSEPIKEKPQVLTRLLEINSIPSGADIWVNGKKLGNTPFRREVKDGLRFKVSISKDNYRSWEQEVVVNKDIKINAKLQKQTMNKETTGQYTQSKKGGKKWIWIVGGIAATGGVVAAVLLSGNGSTANSATFPEPPDRP